MVTHPFGRTGRRWLTRSALLVALSMGCTLLLSAPSVRADLLGQRWDEVELDWQGQWTRRGNSNMFDARWTHPQHGLVTATLTVNVDAGGNVVITRRDIAATVRPMGWAPGRGCVYRGRIDMGSAAAAGTYSCDWARGPFQWRATILGMSGPTGGSLLGSWRGCDGRVVTFVYEGGEYIGRYTSLGGLAPYHFTLNEVGYRARQQPDGRYVGQVKWRWTSGASQWRPNVITISGNSYRDSGSDSCSTAMSRL